MKNTTNKVLDDKIRTEVPNKPEATEIKRKDDSVSAVSKRTGRAPSSRGEGRWHCLHTSCIGMNPVTRKSNHRVKHEYPNFGECRAFGCI